jgi:prolipoprotein diacylglyceryltransferase
MGHHVHRSGANLNVGTPLNVPLHPTQAYESIAGLVILLALLAFERRGRQFPGRTFWMFVLLYSVSRFIIEFYRGDDRGFVFDMVSTSQAISLVLARSACSCSGTWPAGAATRRKRREGRESPGSRRPSVTRAKGCGAALPDSRLPTPD